MENQQLKKSVYFSAFKGEFYKSINSYNADILLSEIKQVRNQLIQSKKIGNYKVLDIDVENNLWDIPSNWAWTRAGHILDVRDGTHDTPKYVSDEGFPLITSKNLKNNTLDFSNVKLISNEDHFAIQKRSKVDKDDILFAMIGTIGNPVIVKEDREFSIKNVGLFKKIPETNINMEYIFFYLDFISDMLRKNSSGAVQSFVSLKVLRNLPVPLPPFEDQQIIVDYLNEINVHLSKIDQKIKKLNTLQLNFPFQLEKSILQYAMQGKLVNQDNSDESASTLLKRISEKKEQMVKEKVIKKEKTLPPITEEEIPFDIPDTWEWVRLKNISTFGNFNQASPEKIKSDDWVLDLEELEKNTGRILEQKKASEKMIKSNKYKFNQNDVLYGKLRPYLNKVTIAPHEGYCTTEIFPITLIKGVYPKYIQYVLMSPYFLNYAHSLSYGVKMPRLGTTQIANALIPLPPANEQIKIVEKIEEMIKPVRNLSLLNER
ncbi:restriction endonuclease subunit S [Exiguobacterium sp. s37]|uniref:restriction endonuclease subunit S n=1 Tax=Exiguobacterium sp. s37 TaxID=2751275 RepID=UPI001BED02FC|nr:restriction endonuclease subunit S [Exiguobacterium sp. s37]